MRRLIEPSHLDLCCRLQKPIISPVAVKELKCFVFSKYQLLEKQITDSSKKSLFAKDGRAHLLPVY